MRTRLALSILLTSLLATSSPLETAAGPDSGSGAADQAAIQEAASWIAQVGRADTEYHYVMTCKVRLLVFWAGRDDVGGGYVRIGETSGQERQQMIQVLFGSDPIKAPLSINRWGAGTEVLRNPGSSQVASAFFGFMKSSKGQSPLAMRSELAKEKAAGDHLFEGIISRVDDQALSTTVPFVSNRDFDFHDYAGAEEATLQQLKSNPSRHIRRLDGTTRQACPSTKQFLATTLELMDDAVAGHPTPRSLCYVYNAHRYKATLLSVHPVAEKKIHVTLHGNGSALDQTYHRLREAHFEVMSEETGSKSAFEILLGTEGNQRGAPIQITYEPNWWFQIILNLTPNTPQPPT